MKYVIIPTKDKSETAFFMKLLKKLDKQASSLSSEKMEDASFIAALKESEKSGKGGLSNVKSHLSRISSGK